MKTVFEKTTCDELIDRLGRLTADSERQWGKMSASQMMEHVSRVLEMATGKNASPQSGMGKALSWIFIRGFLSDKPMPKGAPTGPDFLPKDEPNFEATRNRLRQCIGEFYTLGESGTDGNVHRFFGRLTGKQWGETQYKHLDHHLRQFGV
jgi:hypothetical protein